MAQRLYFRFHGGCVFFAWALGLSFSGVPDLVTALLQLYFSNLVNTFPVWFYPISSIPPYSRGMSGRRFRKSEPLIDNWVGKIAR